MNNSLCVSISTTTPQRRRHPKLLTQLEPSRDVFGNASSVHYFGQQAKAAIDQARSATAELIRANPRKSSSAGGTGPTTLRFAAQPTRSRLSVRVVTWSRVRSSTRRLRSRRSPAADGW